MNWKQLALAALLFISGKALTDAEYQACHDHLDKLDAAEEENSSVDNTCEQDVVGDDQQYKFHVQYNAPYYHDAGCTEQKIEFEGIWLNEGNGAINEWVFDPLTQEIVFNIRHDDLVPVYGCEYIVEDTQYTWICDMGLHIYFEGVEQFEYAFKMQATLSRDYTNSLDITVEKNLVTGDCCENELSIVTDLKFCETYACDNYLPAPLTVKRKQDVYVEHFIVTPEFQYYFLHGLSLKLGAFFPKIIKQNGTQPGRLIYHFISNIAMENLTLTAISRIDENPSRRRLAADVGDNYRIKAENFMTIEDENAQNTQEQQQQSEESDNTVLIAVIAVVGVLCLASIAGATFYFLKNKKPEQKYEETQSAKLDKITTCN